MRPIGGATRTGTWLVLMLLASRPEAAVAYNTPAAKSVYAATGTETPEPSESDDDSSGSGSGSGSGSDD